MNKTIASLAALSCSTVLAGVVCADDSVSGRLGAPAAVATARVVQIDVSTSLIKVDHFERITIQNSRGQSFGWRFDTLYCPTGFPLKSIAPPDFEAGDTWVYVRPKPRSERKRAD